MLSTCIKTSKALIFLIRHYFDAFVHISLLFFSILARPRHEEEDFEEETIEDDEAELTLSKVEEEIMVSVAIFVLIDVEDTYL